MTRFPLSVAALVAFAPFLLGQSSLSSRVLNTHRQSARVSATRPASQTFTVTVGPNGTLTFSPSTLNISVGDTVQWTWASSNHSATSGNCCSADNKFCSPNDLNCPSAPLSSNGATYSHTFTQAGSFPYFCRAHGSSGMTGTVVVAPPPVQISSVSRPTSGPMSGHFIINGQTASNITVTIKAAGAITGRFDPIGTAGSDATGTFHFDDPGAATIQPQMQFYEATYP